MIGLSRVFIMVLATSLTLSPSFVSASDNQLMSVNSSISTDFGDNLKSKIQDLISNSLNDTDKIINSSSLLGNGSNMSSSQVIISKNKVTSVNSNTADSSSSSSRIMDQVKTINGVCTSIKVGGNGNDTLYSSGNCNDELTGGLGADNFTCGEGNDTIKDYNPEEGDVISDRQNCEKIL